MLRFLTTVTIVFGVAASFALAESRTHGHLILNGGGSKPDVVMEKFIELAGGPEAQIVVLPTASGEPDTGEYYQELFAQYGCSNVLIADVKSKDEASGPEVAALVRGAGGIWFSGGDQRRITNALLGTLVGEAVTAAFSRGAVVGGTSAGTACQSGLMITGDGDFTVINADNIELGEGLGLFDGVIVDQHHIARRRNNRLISVVLEHPELIGVGIDEGTAVWVRPDGTFEVLGDGWVVVYDATRGEVTGAAPNRIGKRLGVHGMTTHVLLSGDVFDVKRREIVTDGRTGR